MQRLHATIIALIILAFVSQSVAALGMNCVHSHTSNDTSFQTEAMKHHHHMAMSDVDENVNKSMDIVKNEPHSQHQMPASDCCGDECSCIATSCSNISFITHKLFGAQAISNAPKFDFYQANYSLSPPHNLLRPPSLA